MTLSQEPFRKVSTDVTLTEDSATQVNPEEVEVRKEVWDIPVTWVSLSDNTTGYDGSSEERWQEREERIWMTGRSVQVWRIPSFSSNCFFSSTSSSSSLSYFTCSSPPPSPASLPPPPLPTPPASTCSSCLQVSVPEGALALVNSRGVGYYRVHYGQDTWQRIADILQENHQAGQTQLYLLYLETFGIFSLKS